MALNSANTDPLTYNVRIVDPKTGFPTPEFMAKWQRLKAFIPNIPGIIQPGDVLGNLGPFAAYGSDTTLTALFDQAFGKVTGDLLQRGASAWQVLAPGAANDVLISNGTSALLSYSTLSALMDAVFGSAQGDILYRDSAAWKVLAPGTSGWFLQTQGAAANPVWAAASGLSAIADGDILSNITGGSAVPSGNTLTATLDHIFSAAQGDILYRGASVWSVLAPGTANYVLNTGGAGANPSWVNNGIPSGGGAGQVLAKNSSTNYDVSWVAASSVTSSVDAVLDAEWFGNGQDGNVTISSGTTKLTRDMYYANLTLNGTGVLDTNRWRVFVNGTLDISAAQAGAIISSCGAVSGNLNGGNGNGTTSAGSGAGGVTGGIISSTTSGGGGGVGTTTTGGNGGASTNNANLYCSTTGSASGAGGAGTSAGGGSINSGTGTVALAVYDRVAVDMPFVIQGSAVSSGYGGISGSGGSAGGGDSTNKGGYGGGGGAAGGIVFVSARTVNRGGSTAQATVKSAGGNGGNGGNTTTGNVGGGGGGAAGAGGWLIFIYRLLAGSTGASILDASAGTGGNGGSGHGTGAGGAGGGTGAKGRITTLCLATGAVTDQASDNTAVGGGAASGTTGGTGASPNLQQLTL